MGLVPLHEVLLLVHLADRLQISPVLLLQRVLDHFSQQSVDRLQFPLHIAQLLAYGSFQLRSGPFLLLGDVQVVLPRRLTIGPRLHGSMKRPYEQLVDDLLAFFSALIQNPEVGRIGDVLGAGSCVNEHTAAVL